MISVQLFEHYQNSAKTVKNWKKSMNLRLLSMNGAAGRLNVCVVLSLSKECCWQRNKETKLYKNAGRVLTPPAQEVVVASLNYAL
jgi:hypothetical protein